MPITHDEAVRSLADIRQAEQTSRRLHRYKHSAPYLFLWGVAWIAGYGATQFAPGRANIIWLAIVLIAFCASFMLRGNREHDRRWRSLGLFLIFGLFISATMIVFGPVPGFGNKIGAFIPLVVATVYAGLGLWAGWRFVIAGAVLAALTLIGFIWMPEYFPLWMAVVGGGTLLLTGLWLRRA